MKENLSFDQFSDYQEAVKLRNKISAENTVMEQQIANVNEQLALKGQTIDDEAHALLSPGVVDDHPTRDKLQGDLSDLYHRRIVLRKALEIQDKKIAEIESSHSHEICGKLRPRYIELARRVLTALQELCAANEAEEIFVDELRIAGIRFNSWLPRAHFNGVDKWDDSTGGRVYYYRKFIEENYPELTGDRRP